MVLLTGRVDSLPWLKGGLEGGVAGLFGASLFIGVSWLTRTLAEERRSRRLLNLLGAPQPSAAAASLEPVAAALRDRVSVENIHRAPPRLIA
jgi:hypothetical protein